MSTDVPRIRDARVRAVSVPLPVPHRTASGVLTDAPLALIDLTTDTGAVGRSYVFTYTPLALAATVAMLRELAGLIAGMPLAPVELANALRSRFRLLGTPGIVQMALAGIDMAAWDALAVALDRPLYALLGGARRPLEAYLSLGMMSPEGGARAAAGAAADGFRAVKFKIGGPDAAADLAFVAAVREAAGASMGLMVDYNQSLTAAEAVRRGRALEPYDLTWLEEPCPSDDDAGHAVVAAALDLPVIFGENWWSPAETARAIALRALDEVMIDVMKIGGVGGWHAAAALAGVAGLRVSSHLFPEFSLHLMAVTPSARFIEWLDLASPILAEPILPRDGHFEPLDRPGVGLAWNASAVERYALT